MEKLSLQGISVMRRTNGYGRIYLLLGLGVGPRHVWFHSDVRDWHEYYIPRIHAEEVSRCSMSPSVPNFKMLVFICTYLGILDKPWNICFSPYSQPTSQLHPVKFCQLQQNLGVFSSLQSKAPIFDLTSSLFTKQSPSCLTCDPSELCSATEISLGKRMMEVNKARSFPSLSSS